MRRWLIAGWALAISACSDGGGSGELAGTCDLAASTSGAVAWTSAGNPACVIPFGGTRGIDMTFNPLSEVLATFEVDIAQIHEGETGEFPSTVRVNVDATTAWTTASCTVTVTEHTFTGRDDGFAREFQTAGTGACTDAAIRTGSADTVTIAPFAFRFPAHW